jgi:PAS domain S-box-containing protein
MPASHEAAPALFRLLSDSALYRAAMSASRIPLALLDAGQASTPFVFVNHAFERLSGYAERDALGRPVSLALVASSKEASLGTLLALTGNTDAANAGLRIACRVLRRDATERAVLAAFDPVRDKLGRISHWIVALEDAPAAL